MAVNPNKPVGLGDTDYARRTRALIKAVGESRALGGQGDLDLPSIAVIGNQSAGKSSLIEAITGITVPRAANTCTRCPMECRLQQSNDAWHARILLRIEKTPEGQRLADIREIPFGPVVTDTRDLERMLRRAQLAILNPRVSAERFINLDVDNRAQLSHLIGPASQLNFSSNVVCVDVSGPHVPDLSFTDLPGIISNEDDGGSIDAVRNMVMNHITGNCLILLTITMRDDIANQSAAFFARQVDPDGLRTIGVLTKPDTLQADEEFAGGWVDILEGKSHRLAHGYYITKQPAHNELAQNLPFDEARRREKAYFDTHPTWSSRNDAIKKRMGTFQLAGNLSKLLSNLIDQTIPKLREDLRKLQLHTKEELRALPQPLSQDPILELRNLITEFTSDLVQSIQGLLKHRCNEFYGEFRMDISRTAPVFIPKIRPAALASTRLAVPPSRPAIPPRPTLPARPGTPSRPALPSRSAPTSPSMSDFHNGEHPSQTVDMPNDQPGAMYLDDLKTWIDSRVTQELPGSVPFSAQVKLILRSFDGWDDITRECSAKVFAATFNHATILVTKYFHMFSTSSLNAVVKSIVDQQMDAFRERTNDRLGWLVSLESAPYTQNDEYFFSHREKYLAMYKSERPSAKPLDVNNAEQGMKYLQKAGYEINSVEELSRLQKADPFDRELLMAAEVRSYFQVAQKRIIDNVPRTIDHFLRGLGAEIEQGLMKQLLSNDRVPAASYMVEDPGTTLRREELIAKEVRLREISTKLIAATA